MEINDNLATNSQAVIDAVPHYITIKSSFEMNAIKKEMIYKTTDAERTKEKQL